MRGLPKCFEQGRQGGFRCAGTFGVTAHSVDNDQQHGLLGSRYGNPILILFAMAD
jgi:hypothetical protein